MHQTADKKKNSAETPDIDKQGKIWKNLYKKKYEKKNQGKHKKFFPVAP